VNGKESARESLSGVGNCPTLTPTVRKYSLIRLFSRSCLLFVPSLCARIRKVVCRGLRRPLREIRNNTVAILSTIQPFEHLQRIACMRRSVGKYGCEYYQKNYSITPPGRLVSVAFKSSIQRRDALCARYGIIHRLLNILLDIAITDPYRLLSSPFLRTQIGSVAGQRTTETFYAALYFLRCLCSVVWATVWM